MVVAAVTQAENARAGLGEDAGEEFRTDGDVGGWWIRWMGGKERVRMRKKREYVGGWTWERGSHLKVTSWKGKRKGGQRE